MMILKTFGIPGKCPAHNRSWTEAEEQLLIEMYPVMTYAEIAKKIRRGEDATRMRARRLRLEGRLPYKHNFFTPEQDAFIRENRHTLSVSEVAKRLGKTRGNIGNRLRILGVSYFKCGDLNSNTRHSDEDVTLIRALRNEGLTFKDIAEKFEVSPDIARALYHRRLIADDAIAREYLPQ